MCPQYHRMARHGGFAQGRGALLRVSAMSSLPNILTLSRIFAVPLLAFFLWWPEWRLGYLIGFVLYTIIAITDYIDGYLARSYGTVSKLGTFLDPIADKIMVAAGERDAEWSFVIVDRHTARMIAKRINECLDATVKR